MIKLAIVSPCYNEEEVLEQSAARLTALFDELVGKEKISADSFVSFSFILPPAREIWKFGFQFMSGLSRTSFAW